MSETELLAAALKFSSEQERAEFLAAQCANNPQLRERIEQLLVLENKLHGQAPLDPAGKTDHSFGITVTERAESSILEQAGEKIGPYELVAVIGEGGMGTVWRAKQNKPVRREVALKVIKVGMDTREVIARFEAERQALALMNHPNIARVHDAGETKSGRPYFVMELVIGTAITDYCDQHQLSIEERLRMFIDICDAVQHAHQKGIIHRDLKPSNVLVTEQSNHPAPKVIDFGLAKATSQSLTDQPFLTAFGQLMGTPTYMSPEQADISSLDVDTRTDVYSLGVLLYQILTGVPPFDFKEIAKSGYAEVLRTIREIEAPAMTARLNSLQDDSLSVARVRKTDRSKLMQMLYGDLEIIVRKAIEKDRGRRYQSPTELANDIQRFLTNEPIEARPATLVYRFRKSIQRNKLAVVSLVLIAASLIAGIAISTRQAIRATLAERESANRLIETTLAKDQAEKSSIKAQQAAQTATAINDFILLDILAAPNPYDGKGQKVTVNEAMHAAEKNIGLRFKNEPAVEAAVRAVFGQTFAGLGEMKEAAQQTEQAWKIFQQELGDNAPETLFSEAYLARLVHQLQKYDEAEKILRDVIPRCETYLGLHDYTTINAKIYLGETLQVNRRFDESDTLFQQALKDLERYHPERYQGALMTISSLSASLLARGKLDQAVEWTQRQIDVAVATSQQEAEIAGLNTLGNIYISAERYEKALEIQAQLLKTACKILPAGHWHLAVIRAGQARALRELGRGSEAIPVLVSAYESMRDSLGRDNYNTVKVLTSLVELLDSNGMHEELDKYRRDFMLTWLRTANRDQLDRVETAIDLYLDVSRRPNPISMTDFHNDLLAHKKEFLAEGHDRRGQFASNLGSWLLKQKEFEKAEPLLLEGMSTWKGNDDDVGHVSWQREQLFKLYEALNRPDEAAHYVKR